MLIPYASAPSLAGSRSRTATHDSRMPAENAAARWRAAGQARTRAACEASSRLRSGAPATAAPEDDHREANSPGIRIANGAGRSAGRIPPNPQRRREHVDRVGQDQEGERLVGPVLRSMPARLRSPAVSAIRRPTRRNSASCGRPAIVICSLARHRCAIRRAIRAYETPLEHHGSHRRTGSEKPPAPASHQFFP